MIILQFELKKFHLNSFISFLDSENKLTVQKRNTGGIKACSTRLNMHKLRSYYRVTVAYIVLIQTPRNCEQRLFWTVTVQNRR